MKTMEIREIHEIHGSHDIHENHGNPQDSREFCGNQRNPWNPIELNANQGKSFEFHRVVGIIWV